MIKSLNFWRRCRVENIMNIDILLWKTSMLQSKIFVFLRIFERYVLKCRNSWLEFLAHNGIMEFSIALIVFVCVGSCCVFFFYKMRKVQWWRGNVSLLQKKKISFENFKFKRFDWESWLRRLLWEAWEGVEWIINSVSNH